MSAEAIKALEAEISEVEQEQEPTRVQIAELTAKLSEGDETIRRNRAAIALLNGETPMPAPSRTRARRSLPSANGSAAFEVSKDRVVDYLGGNPNAKAAEIADAIGTGGPALTKALREMMDEGIVTKTGEKRGTRYTLKVG